MGQKDVSMMMVSGNEGSGKSTFIANLWKELSNKAYTVIPFFGNISRFSGNVKNMIQYFVYEITKLNEGAAEFNKLPDIGTEEGRYLWTEELKNQINLYNKSNSSKIVFLIDGLSRIKEQTYSGNFWFWISAIRSTEVHLIFTCENKNSLDIKEEISVRIKESVYDPTEFQIPKLSMDEIENSFLELLGMKEVGNRVWKKIITKKNINNFLYLKLIYERLNMFDKWDHKRADVNGKGIEGIQKHQEQLVEDMPDNIKQMWCYFAQEVEGRVGCPGCMQLLQIMACTRTGLRITDIQEVLKKSGYICQDEAFYRIMSFLDEYLFVNEDGRIGFVNASFRSAMFNFGQLKKVYLYVKKLPANDVVYKNEMVYLLCAMRDYKTLFDFLVRVEMSKDDKLIACILDKVIDYLNNDCNVWMEEKIEEWISIGKNCYEVFDIFSKFFVKIIRKNFYMDIKCISNMFLKTIYEIVDKHPLDDEKLLSYYELILELDKHAKSELREQYLNKINEQLNPYEIKKAGQAPVKSERGQYVENIRKQAEDEMKFGDVIVSASIKEILTEIIYNYTEVLSISKELSALYEWIYQKIAERVQINNNSAVEWTSVENTICCGVILFGISNVEYLNEMRRRDYLIKAMSIVEKCEWLMERYRGAENWNEKYNYLVEKSAVMFFLASDNSILNWDVRIRCAISVLVFHDRIDRKKAGFNVRLCKERLLKLGVISGEVRIRYAAWSEWSEWTLRKLYASQLRQVKSKTGNFKRIITMLTGYRIITYKDHEKPKYKTVKVLVNPAETPPSYTTVKVLESFGTSVKREPIHKEDTICKNRKIYSYRIRGVRSEIENSDEMIEEYLVEEERKNPWMILDRFREKHN